VKIALLVIAFVLALIGLGFLAERVLSD